MIILIISVAIFLALSVPVCMYYGKPIVRPAQPDEGIALGGDLPTGYMGLLRAAGWDERVGDAIALWVSVARQELIGIQNGRVVCRYPCSTAAAGAGSRVGSWQTPLGWHVIDERIGDGLPVGAIFKERKYTGRVWDPENRTHDDLILTRIMWLRGLEPGLNLGEGVDSHARFIYIHGTPEEDRLGTPASLGCIRMANRDVAELYDLTTTGTPVLITEW
ncbi:MAG TPA: L,D-transpeptidase [Phycisphaerae bacterium]|nr:L,D-transpeptidase [Phycisphaerae bacterium]